MSPDTPPASVLEVRNLNVELDGHPLLSGVSFDLNPAEITGLCGDSGCGKTTLALSLLCLLPADRYRVRGSVRLDRRELLTLSEPELESIRGAQISMIFRKRLTNPS